MEKLKSLVPSSIKQMIANSSEDDLPSTCESLLNFFLNLDQFHQVVRDLVDPGSRLCGKNSDAAIELKLKGNQCYLSGDYAKALSFYTQALRIAPVDSIDKDRNLVATLFLNRASLLQKMDLLVECLQDCNRALQISPTYTKAWYRRGKVNASLGNYEDAVQDLIIAKDMEPSSGGKKQIESELKIILDQSKSAGSKFVQKNANNLRVPDEPVQVNLQCVITPDKGRGMASQCDIPESSLVHREEPYAVIILKHCRETYCHYCLNKLPADAIPCTSCSIPLYCSHNCQVLAGGQLLKNFPMKHSSNEILFNKFEEYIAQITRGIDFYPGDEHFFEHKHECQGAHWPMILPSDIVLAGRVLVKCIEQRRACSEGFNLTETLELSHNYLDASPESKLESHIYSIVLLYCIQHSYGFELPINGASISQRGKQSREKILFKLRWLQCTCFDLKLLSLSILQIVILIFQIRVNSMAIVCMKSNDDRPPNQFGDTVPGGTALTSTLEQIRVGQAIYAAGSLFNHSCRPNIHAYFLSRTLIIRTTEFVTSGCPLELSYGPQVGQWDCKDRLQFLEGNYSFRCRCSGCSEVNLSDLVINAFHCINPTCSGIVLDCSVVNCEKQKLKQFPKFPKGSSSESHLQIGKLSCDYIDSVGYLALQKKNRTLDGDPGYCLKCGSYCNLESSCAAVDEAWIYIKRYILLYPIDCMPQLHTASSIKPANCQVRGFNSFKRNLKDCSFRCFEITASIKNNIACMQ
ncbi:SET and MYND domain-containing protein 4 isoform X4 [Mangifera indica]|uniref:SET and MYND domain-containing protein 4 isoform X4 n=1 Tax=Mangifera indica TaxID=29780 RepID=UPI001CF96D90|nr:SET and MYND domain-containing protein 4 isoform X4 [Mangifera indica]